MYLGRVVGCLWATVKNPSMEGQRLLVVQPLTPELKPTGKKLICTDWAGAGAGELIYWVRGREASHALLPAEVPTDTTIIAIVDELSVDRDAAARRKTAAAAPPGKPLPAEPAGAGTGVAGEPIYPGNHGE
jgi:ethanolamine utilization protein EutN